MHICELSLASQGHGLEELDLSWGKASVEGAARILGAHLGDA